jgi:hypothetical protein
MCAFHHNESHKGDWRDCARCATTSLWQAQHQFQWLAPKTAPDPHDTCSKCGKGFLSDLDGYTYGVGGMLCLKCGGMPFF